MNEKPVFREFKERDWEHVSRIYQRLGFRKVSYRERIGKMNGIWRDTVLLEKRSD